MWQRILGLIMMGIGVIGIGLSVVGLISGLWLMNDLSRTLEENLTLTIESLETVRQTLLLTRDTVAQANEGLTVVEEMAGNVSTTLEGTQPLLEQVAQVVGEDVPESIEAIQSSMPALEQAASAIDDTLRTLSAFNRSFLGIDLELGVEYDPETPFDESVATIGDSLEGVPERLRSLQTNLDETQQSLGIISENLSAVANNLHEVNGNVAEMEPLLDDYIALITEFTDSARQTRENLKRQMWTVRIGMSAVMIWLGLTQIAPLYLGWELLSGRRNKLAAA